MKIEHRIKSLLLIVAALVTIEPLLSAPAVAKNCNAASAQGRGGLNCGPAPVTSNSQATGQVTGTKPSQVGAPSIGTSNQNPAAKPPVTTVPAALPPKVDQQTPMRIPPKVDQQTPMRIPPKVDQQTPMLIPPKVDQQTPMLIPPKVDQQTPMLIPPKVDQQTPMLIPPKAEQKTPVLVPVPIKMKVPQKSIGSVPSPNLPTPVNPPLTKGGSGPSADGYVTPRPKPISSTPSAKAAAASAPASTSAQPVLVITPDATTANRNDKMITVEPGRQAANNYPTFNVDSATPNRVCVVSGLERRKTVESSGSTTYQGTLPTFRMVVAELADLPAWHPIDSGCVVSITHKR